MEIRIISNEIPKKLERNKFTPKMKKLVWQKVEVQYLKFKNQNINQKKKTMRKGSSSIIKIF